MTDRKMTILYPVHTGLYVNLTNKCPCACKFCLRQTMDQMNGSGALWLDHAPTLDEVLAEFSKFDMSQYSELVFCGFGEPTEALTVLLEVARYAKTNYPTLPIRINTNGLGNLIHGRDICPEFEGLIDTLSISLNTPDPERYYQIVRPKFGPASHQAMLDFAREARKFVPKVVLTTVDTTITKAEEQRCREICESLGVIYRIRPWES